MKYIKFIIEDYKAISGSIEVNIRRNSLVPLIGVNESGKTSILWSIFAFDVSNDSLNEGRHLKNVHNLYRTADRGNPSVTAEIEISKTELYGILEDIKDDDEVPETAKAQIRSFKRAISNWKGKIQIRRDLSKESRTYSILDSELFWFKQLNKNIIENIIAQSPYILYFDDFRDIVHEEIEIEKTPSGWLSIIEQLFLKTNSNYTVTKLSTIDELTRKSILADVCKVLNSSLAKEWEKFTLEEGARLDVDISYFMKDERAYLRLLVKENIAGNERYFGIQDRSKGFYWFFNFVMKLEFNPKVRGLEDKDTIYLLDEPGSYLHSSAQSKLCEKLALLSTNNIVIYCTHSHYLLNPDIIPLSSIRIVQKNSEAQISLISLSEYKETRNDRRTAMQPIIDALRIKPFLTDLDYRNICIVEGIYDYYVFELFKDQIAGVKFLPSVDASSIAYFISIAIAWRLNYVALWDNDEIGAKEFRKATEFFGKNESSKFLLLPYPGKRKKKFILQNLFHGTDLKLIRDELDLPENTSFEKTILMLFYSGKYEQIIPKISSQTKENIGFVLRKIEEIMNQNLNNIK